jgi:hypothetical protein
VKESLILKILFIYDVEPTTACARELGRSSANGAEAIRDATTATTDAFFDATPYERLGIAVAGRVEQSLAKW